MDISQQIREIIGTFSETDKQFLKEPDVFENPAYCNVFLSSENKPLAFIEAKEHGSDLRVNIGVVPRYRRHRLANVLFDQFLDWFVQSRYHNVMFSIHTDNEPGIRLAKSLELKMAPFDGESHVLNFCLRNPRCPFPF